MANEKNNASNIDNNRPVVNRQNYLNEKSYLNNLSGRKNKMKKTITLTLSKAQLEALEISLRLHLQVMNQTDAQYHDHLKKSFFDEWEAKKNLHREICNSLNLLTFPEGGVK